MATNKGQGKYVKGRVLASFNTWVVTTNGIECVTERYNIYPKQVHNHDGESYTWSHHMKEKGWVNMSDFNKAYEYALEVFDKSGKLDNR